MRKGRTPPGVASCDAAPNVALVKPWGMRDPSQGLPIHSSLSVTLDHLRTRTTVRFTPELEEDRLQLNGVPSGGAPLAGVQRFLDEVRSLAGIDQRAEVLSTSNFLPSSGLGSAASGFAALAGAASEAAGLTLDPRALSRLARRGFAGAARSVFGGFVQWNAGRSPDGQDCFAETLFPPEHWPQLVDIVVLVADARPSELRSSEAMQTSVRSSPRFGARQRAVPARLLRTRAAIRTRDGPALFREIVDECDEFREVCETTDPPLDYLTPTSRSVLECVRALNAGADDWVAGYTHEAGADIHVFTLQSSASRVRQELSQVAGISRILTLHPGAGLHRIEAPPVRSATAARAGRRVRRPDRARSARPSKGRRRTA